MTKKSLLFWTWDDWKLLDDATVIMRDDTIKVEISKKDLTTMEELPVQSLALPTRTARKSTAGYLPTNRTTLKNCPQAPIP